MHIGMSSSHGSNQQHISSDDIWHSLTVDLPLFTSDRASRNRDDSQVIVCWCVIESRGPVDSRRSGTRFQIRSRIENIIDQRADFMLERFSANARMTQ